MNIFEKKINPDVAVDLIGLVNSCVGFEKKGEANYVAKGQKVNYKWVLLDDVLAKVKENENFALLQPLGQDENGSDVVKTILIHKSGEVLESGWFKLSFTDRDTPQDKGTKISYMRRYSLGAFLGISTETDNDGVESDEEDEVDVKLEAKKKKARKEITSWINSATNILGTQEAVFKALGLTRNEVVVDYKAEPIKLLEQIKRIKIDA